MADTAEILKETISYPVLVHETGSSSAGADASRSGGTAPVGALADNTLRDLLGWRYRPDDVKGFVAALGKSFVLREERGHMVSTWNPQGFAIRADLGAITGAQASIYARAKVNLQEVLKLVDVLVPLIPDSDEGDIAAIRTVIRDNVNALVEELGQPAGPRVQRVEALFDILLDTTPAPAARNDRWAHVGGLLGELRKRLALSLDHVDTVDDEQNLTNFMMLVDYVWSLWKTWQDQREMFDRPSTAGWLGQNFTLLARKLDVIVEAVRNAYGLMDSTNFGATERQSELLRFGGQEPAMTAAELLEWVEDFAANQGRQLLVDAGRFGVPALKNTLAKQAELVAIAVAISEDPKVQACPGFKSVRARRALLDIQVHLAATVELASQLHDPKFIEYATVHSVETVRTRLQEDVATLGHTVTSLDQKLATIDWRPAIAEAVKEFAVSEKSGGLSGTTVAKIVEALVRRARQPLQPPEPPQPQQAS